MGGRDELARGGSAASLMVGTAINGGHTGPGASAGGSRGGFADSWGKDEIGGGASCGKAGVFEGFDETWGGCTGVVLRSGVAVRSDVEEKMR